MMKNVLLLTAAFAFVLIGCKKEKTNSDENAQATIVGKWNYVKMDIESYRNGVKVGTESKDGLSGTYIKFEKDLTFATNVGDYGSVVSGSYTVVGDNFILDGHAEYPFKIKLLDKHNLVYEEIDGYYGGKDIYTYYLTR